MSDPEAEDGSEAAVESTAVGDPLREALASLKSKAPAPGGFEAAIEDKIRRRSAGRFFAGRSLAERWSLAALGLLILVVLVVVLWLLRDSDTGSLKLEPGTGAPQIAPGARDAIPRP